MFSLEPECESLFHPGQPGTLFPSRLCSAFHFWSRHFQVGVHPSSRAAWYLSSFQTLQGVSFLVQTSLGERLCFIKGSLSCRPPITLQSEVATDNEIGHDMVSPLIASYLIISVMSWLIDTIVVLSARFSGSLHLLLCPVYETKQ